MSNYYTIKKLRKTFGFNKDREGLITRYLHEKHNWQKHIENTKKYILRSAEDKKKQICVVLGSGWLLDIPLDELHNMFERLIIADISHPSQIKHKAKKYDHLELVDVDISQVLNTLVSKSFKKQKDKNLSRVIKRNHFFGLDKNIKPDFVVSVNLLNQLSFFPKRHLSNMGSFSDKEIKEFIISLEQNHLDNLPKGKSCIIIDHYQLEFDRKEKLLAEKGRISIKLPYNKTKEEWIWDFDLSGNYINGRNVKFKVAALQV